MFFFKIMCTNTNEVLLRNVRRMAEMTAEEKAMMPDGTAPLPSVEQVKRVVSLVKGIVFPDYFYKRHADSQMRSYFIGVSMEELYGLLCGQIVCGLQFCSSASPTSSCNCPCETSDADGLSDEQTKSLAESIALRFVDALPEIKRLIYTDVEAMFQSDPAAWNYGEVIYCYPVIDAMIHYRIAHELHKMKVPVLPRIITEQAHGKTGIDIHPGAQIGDHFAIDHGTGVVIGETAIIGHHVTLYQGVTLGAKSFRYDSEGNMLNEPRHPVIEDHVTIYSNASVLGRITIGHHSVIGGNIWLTHSVPPHSRILQSKAVDVGFQDGLGI